MRRDWFSRRWIVQEIGFARRAIVYCGNEQIRWEELADAVLLVAPRAAELSARLRKEPNYKYPRGYLGNLETFGATRLVDTIDQLFQVSEKGFRPQPSL